MEQLFNAAVNSMLQLYGKSATLSAADGTAKSVLISPLFPAKLAASGTSGAVLEAQANTVISSPELRPEPLTGKLTENGNVWTILSVMDLRACGASAGFYELELKR